jgi:hypothetical protein
MTKLNKYLRREIQVPKSRRPFIIGIDPENQEISLREKGTRKTYKMSILALYFLMVKGEK